MLILITPAQPRYFVPEIHTGEPPSSPSPSIFTALSSPRACSTLLALPPKSPPWLPAFPRQPPWVSKQSRLPAVVSSSLSLFLEGSFSSSSFDHHEMPHWWTPCIEAYPIRMPDRRPAKVKSIDSSSDPDFPRAMPLKEVVANCEQRWFEQTLKAAKSGDISSQCLVGQMFCSGYGVAPNVKKGKFWLQKASELDMEARSLLASLSVGTSIESYMEEPQSQAQAQV